MIYEASIEIERPIEEVFDVATCQRRCVVWASGICNSQMDSDEPAHVGSTFTTDYQILGKIYHLRGVITEIERPHTFVYQIIEGIKSDIHLTFRPTEKGTRLQATFKVKELPALIQMAINNRLAKNAGEYILKRDMGQMKLFMENHIDLWALTPPLLKA